MVLAAMLTLWIPCGRPSASPQPSFDGRATSPSPVAPVSTPSTPAQPTPGQILFEQSGSGNYRTSTFVTHGEWDLIWEVQAAPLTFGGFAVFTVFSGDDYPIVPSINVDFTGRDSKKSDVAPMHWAGTVYIDIQASGSWHVKAVSK